MLYSVHLGPVAVSTACKLVSPGTVVNGTMSITKSELYFEMDEDDPENRKISAEVSGCNITNITHVLGRPPEMLGSVGCPYFYSR